MQDQSLFSDDPTAGHRTYTIDALARAIAASMQREFGTDVWVEGEMRNLNRSAAGHVYFDLVDPCEPGSQPDASLSVVLFRSTREVINRMLKADGGQRMDDGMRVRIRGTLDFYAPQGRLQLRMTGIDPTYMLGQLAADRERILTALRDDDLLEANSRLPIPLLPRRIAVVTSTGSAAERDFISEFERSNHGWEITVVDARVQGFAAVESIVLAIGRAERHGELIALIRGGGARTDLAAFDSELVARAIAASQVPVVTGIGHEIDSTVADEVAAIATKTPTAAAATVVAMVAMVQADVVQQTHRLAKIATTRLATADERLGHLGHRADRAVAAAARLSTNLIADARHRLERAAQRRFEAANRGVVTAAGRAHRAAATTVSFNQQTVDTMTNRLVRAAPDALTMAGERVDRLHATINLVDPVRLQKRGWSITRNESGEVVRSIDQVPDGTKLVTSVTDGHLTSTVTSRDPVASNRE